MSLLQQREHEPTSTSVNEVSHAVEPQFTQFGPENEGDRHVVIADLHGEDEVLHRILDRYRRDDQVKFVFVGDVLDRKGNDFDAETGVFKTLDMLSELGKRAVLTLGNHEWLALGSMDAIDTAERQQIQSDWMGLGTQGSVEANTFSSYGIDRNAISDITVARLKYTMKTMGHYAIIRDAFPFYETDTFIAVHAGIFSDIPWEKQRDDLTETWMKMKFGEFSERPPQWFSMDLANSVIPITATDKIVVSGHSHVLGAERRLKPRGSQFRSLHDGKRIRLASTLNAPTRAPAYVWQDWDGRVVEIRR